jgi:hypothetical protein
MSASPACAVARAAPVPCATKFIVMNGYAAWKASFRLPVPLSSNPVSWRLVVVATVRVMGAFVAEGVGAGVLDGVEEGAGVAVEPGVADVVGAGVAEGVDIGGIVGVGDAVDVGVGAGWLLLVVFCEKVYPAYAPTPAMIMTIRITAIVFVASFIIIHCCLGKRCVYLSITAAARLKQYSHKTQHPQTTRQTGQRQAQRE